MSIVQNDPPDWEDFEAAARRLIEQHVGNSFIKCWHAARSSENYVFR
jgi:hypothetical protein